MKSSHNLSRRLILPILIVLIASFGTLAVINIVKTRSILMDQGSEQINSTLVSSAGQIDALCKRMLTITQAVGRLAESEAESGSVRDEVIESYIKQTMLSEFGYQGLYFNFSEELNKKYNRGTIPGPWWVRDAQAATGIKSMKESSTTYYWEESDDSVWYWQPKKSGRSEWLEPYVDAEMKLFITTLATPVKTKNDLFVGVAGIDIDLNSFIDIAKTFKPSANSQTFLVSRHGTFIYHPNPSFREENATLDSVAKQYKRAEFLTLKNATLSSANEGRIEFVDKATNTSSWLYWTRIPTNGWILASTLPVSDVTQPAFGTLASSMLIALIATLVAIAVVLWILRSQVLSPLSSLTGQAQVLATGDLSVRSNLQCNSEIIALSQAMNGMADYLNEMAGVADKIAGGDLNVEVAPRGDQDRFGQAFAKMVEKLRLMASVADSIAQGDLSLQVKPQSSSDLFGNAFKKMIDNLCSMAEAADTIAKGDLSLEVVPRSSTDAFGNAFAKMVETLRLMAGVADSIAHGDLSARVEPQSPADLFGNAFQQMINNLNSMAAVADAIAKGDLSVQVKPQSSADAFGNAFKEMVDSLRIIIRDLMEGSQSLSAAASELVAVATQQTNTISEQASAIQEISSTLDQIRAIVEQASERAKSVVQVSEQALDISETGQQELNEVVEAMGKIQEQVEAITDNIVDLSEKTVQIGDITSSVNEIAEQSNLLAVNAAIEATKAGKVGKGFGVVAVEVKNLASRSKKATSQVKSILTEIQRAADSTVLVTEEGSKCVEAGVDQVQRIGDNIKVLHKVIVESSSVARLIAATTNQQVIGIEQIAIAMKHISKGANEGVVSAKQQKATSYNLSQLAGSLNSIVHRYRL